MCCVRVGSQKLHERWRAEQTKRQGIFAIATNWVLVCGEFKPYGNTIFLKQNAHYRYFRFDVQKQTNNHLLAFVLR